MRETKTNRLGTALALSLNDCKSSPATTKTARLIALHFDKWAVSWTSCTTQQSKSNEDGMQIMWMNTDDILIFVGSIVIVIVLLLCSYFVVLFHLFCWRLLLLFLCVGCGCSSYSSFVPLLLPDDLDKAKQYTSCDNMDLYVSTWPMSEEILR